MDKGALVKISHSNWRRILSMDHISGQKGVEQLKLFRSWTVDIQGAFLSCFQVS